MESLNSLKKQELLDLAKAQNLPATTKMTKPQLIDLITNPPKESATKKVATKVEKATKTSKTTTKTAKPKKSEESSKVEKVAKPKKSTKTTVKKEPKVSDKKAVKLAKSSKVAVPTRDIIATFDNNITILVQSHDTALIIWNADPALDEQVSGWRFKNDKGLDIFVPSYARSAFVDISLLQISEHTISFTLLRVGEDGSQTEHTRYYTTTFRAYSQQITEADIRSHLDEYSKIQYRFNS